MSSSHKSKHVHLSEDLSASSTSSHVSQEEESKPTGTKKDAKEVEDRILKSIPEKELGIVKNWQVKQVVITRTGHSGEGPSIPGIHVNQPPAPLRKLSRMGTSKIHKFKPSVSLEQAITWISEYGLADSSILFDNDCAFILEQAKFFEFEDVRDEE